MSFLVEWPLETYQASGDAFAAFSPAQGFSLGTARALMWLSQLAYETDEHEKIEAVGRLWGIGTPSPFTHSSGLAYYVDTRGLIARRDGLTIVAFTGTDPGVIDNLVTDLMIMKDAESGAHAGFVRALDAVWAQIDTAIGASLANVIFTGHSLGAALATLAAQRAAAARLQLPLAVYTFGSPRLFATDSAKSYDDQLGKITYRLVHGDDIVAAVTVPGIGARHVGRYLHCASGGKFDVSLLASAAGSDEPGFKAGLMRGIGRDFLRLWRGPFFAPKGPGHIGNLFSLLPLPVRDHLPDRYVAALKP